MSEIITAADYMKRAFDLALLGKGAVSPNPMVGCVIVHNDVIIGEGYHEKYGGPHAEVNAILSVKDEGLLAEATAYVSLEPCSHTGKTPPCANLLVEKGLRHVVLANLDPNPLVAGKGIAYLESHGVRVESGLMAEFGVNFNRRFFKAMRTQMPYIILKWAETADGYIADSEQKPIKISNTIMDITVHRWRAEEDAILIGMQTVLSDNPRLNNRLWEETKSPIRVILGKWADIPTDAHVLDDSIETYIFDTVETGRETENVKKQTKLVNFPSTELDLEFVLKFLFKNNIHSILVEGGAKTIGAFIRAGLYDEIRQIKNTTLNIGQGVEAPKIPSGISFIYQKSIIDNILSVYKKTIPTK